MRKYDDIYITLSEIMERVDKRIEEERQNGTIQTSTEEGKNDQKQEEISAKNMPKSAEDKKKSAEDETTKIAMGY